ncbi:MAG: flagellar type III secretion system pore protein FliP [Litorimonas sp.]
MSFVRGAYLVLAALAALGLLFGFAPDALAQVVPAEPGTVPDALQNGVRDAMDAPVSLDVSIVQLFLLVTVLSLAPGLAMMVTCLPLIVIVLSFLRQALGLQQTPPNSMIMGLALILTFFIMEPVFAQSWAEGVQPYMDGMVDEATAFDLAIEPFRAFMSGRVDAETIQRLADSLPGREWSPGEEPSLGLLTSAFMLSEIKTAFQIGFAIFLPFLAIDLAVASVLMAMGMMMVPPAVVSLPFKLGFFVLADGWLKITEALLQGYAL